MEDTFETLLAVWEDVKLFFRELTKFIFKSFHISFLKFEQRKGVFVTALYRQRGKLARRLTHSGMAVLTALGVVIAPVIAQEFPGRNINPWEVSAYPSVLSASTDDPEIDTLVSSKVRDKIIEYQVQEGDTIKSIAQKFGVDEDTIRWQNDLTGDKIKIGQTLEVLPVTGIAHKIVKGDTVYSIAKRYDTEPQAIVDFPFNTFSNDETFELAIGQIVVVPDGVRPAAIQTSPRIRQITPDAGTVVASGQFVWPTAGSITQRFVWYHKGVDIANRGTPAVLAADSGRVVVAGWPDGSGYGNRVMIDHGNGFKTLYAHLSKIYVIPGQTVGRGAPIGQMGSTGRSTGPHLHFEIIQNGVYLNPLNFLR
ncbi:MAG: Peptidase M23 family protein [Candidatus Woesebacteria bacterium GW2011_GWB1_45_5]|uniref:Peptidase M23 family protein n=1 Tax=Candidatus Woesebacteria bacterium GW2011_GWB1_45_5 TaxID=1618581 RepID=A0A0G1PZ76_9BACT|nr:MAG: Peptidase M23 family protein [Candidatus Woesebacteria bacterium GW2011_GWB1_45_5]